MSERSTWQVGWPPKRGGDTVYGYKCERCGAYLDPGEKCDCAIEREKAAELRAQSGKQIKKRTSRRKAALCKA